MREARRNACRFTASAFGSDSNSLNPPRFEVNCFSFGSKLSRMQRSWRAAAAVFFLVLLVGFGISANEGLAIEIVGDQQMAATPFEVRIRNDGNKRLTFCLSVCGTIIDTETNHAAPAFAVEKRTGKQWGEQPWGCGGAANNFTARVIQVGEVQKFRIKLTELGTYRLRLAYKDVSADRVSSHCEAIEDPKSLKHAVSEEFEVTAKPK
jgi:hypothetical protein